MFPGVKQGEGGAASLKRARKDCFSLIRLSLGKESPSVCRKVRNRLGDPLPETAVEISVFRGAAECKFSQA